MEGFDLNKIVEDLKIKLGSTPMIVVKRIYIGKPNPLEAVVIYVNGLVNKDMIDRDILTPLMIHVNEDIRCQNNITDYLCKSYIAVSNIVVDKDINKAVENLKRGKTIVVIETVPDFIIIDTTGGNYRAITEPVNETVIKGPREGFVENLETNVSIIRRKIKDKSLKVESLTVGRRSQNDIVLLYLEDVVDTELLQNLRNRISAVDVDGDINIEKLVQYIEDDTYTIFPQIYTSERPDIAVADIMEGRVVVLCEGTATYACVPSVFIQFFQAVEDYNQRTIAASFIRIIRIIACIIVISLPSIYLTLIKYNVELIPLKFVTPIVQSRIGIALTPFLEILAMEITVELLREGGIRLPSKIGQTLSLVGGIIIGDTAIKSRIVSPSTLLIVGVTVIATFLIPNYDMAVAVRLLRFPMLILANMMGIFGIAIGWYLILVHLCSLKTFGVSYFDLSRSDLKDTFIRAPLWKMKKRPECVPNNNNNTRQGYFRDKIKGTNNDDEKQ